MTVTTTLLEQLRIDLSIGHPFIKGHLRPVRNCWHFSSDGNCAFALFETEADFKAAMNRLARLALRSRVLILAFCLMDNHVHFVLYGELQDCEAFTREFLNLTAHYNSRKRGIGKGTASIPVSHQRIDDEEYLLNCICYDLRNPPVNGLKYTFYDYPWSSGPLYFRSAGTWTAPLWTCIHKDCPAPVASFFKVCRAGELGPKALKKLLGSEQPVPEDWMICDGMVLPSSYIPVGTVEALFKSHRAFNFFIGRNKEKEMEDIMGVWTSLNLQDTEMRRHRDEEITALYGSTSIRDLNMPQRIEVGRILRKKYMTSVKQIARTVCIPLEEAEKAIR